MDTWLAIDGTNWIHALWHALRGSGVFEGFRRRAELLAAHVHATRVLIALDRRSFRHELATTYKAGRKPRDAGLQDLIERAADQLGDAGQPVYQDGFEADDCLATAAAAAIAAGCRCVLATADKDVWQCLVEGRVSALRSFATRGSDVVDCRWQTAGELEIAEDTCGLRPTCWADYQCLVGESGDNVPGCPGWGAVTSRKALAGGGSIDKMLRDPWSVSCSTKQRDALLKWAKDGGLQLARQLITLRTDVPAILDAVK